MKESYKFLTESDFLCYFSYFGGAEHEYASCYFSKRRLQPLPWQQIISVKILYFQSNCTKSYFKWLIMSISRFPFIKKRDLCYLRAWLRSKWQLSWKPVNFHQIANICHITEENLIFCSITPILGVLNTNLLVAKFLKDVFTRYHGNGLFSSKFPLKLHKNTIQVANCINFKIPIYLKTKCMWLKVKVPLKMAVTMVTWIFI